MSLRRYCLLAVSVLPAHFYLPSTASASANDPTPIQRSAQAFSQGKPVSSIVLNASVEWIAGSDDETGNATLTANADGSFSVQLQLPKSSRTESQTSFSAGQSCSWTGADGVAHIMPRHNCSGSMAWFLPAVAFFGGQQPTAMGTTVTAAASSPFVDIMQQRQPSSDLPAATTSLLMHLSTSHLYLDPVTSLPSALSFETHPDGNSGVDIPVRVVFTNYQQVNGVMIPYRIQRYINGTLNLDLTVTQASVN